LEELENLEETLNDSIKESIGARGGKISNGKNKGAAEDEEEYLRYFIYGKFFFQTKTTRLTKCYHILISLHLWKKKNHVYSFPCQNHVLIITCFT
jgi:hypothetical protein